MNEKIQPYENTGGSVEELQGKFEQFALSIGDSIDADGAVRFKTWNDANEFVEMAAEAGIKTILREPRPERKGMSDFAKYINSLYEVKVASPD